MSKLCIVRLIKCYLLIFLKQTTLARLKPLCIATSHVYFNKKMDEFGKDHTHEITEAVKNQAKVMEALSNSSGNSTENLTQDPGRKLTFDNIDFRQKVHHMSEDNQNIDKHCVTIMSTENRVSGNHLSNDPPEGGIMDMPNGICIPDQIESQQQRENYITLVERLLCKYLPCLEFLSDVTVQHIPHLYKKEMSAKTKTVSIVQSKDCCFHCIL